MTANLENKIVKIELLEMILSKGCKILNVSNSTIIGSLSSEMKSQLRVLDLSFTVPNGNFQAIIKCCQELKDVDLGYINEDEGLSEEDLELLAEKIPPNVEKLNLSHQDVKDDYVKILLRRCSKTLITGPLQDGIMFMVVTFMS